MTTAREAPHQLVFEFDAPQIQRSSVNCSQKAGNVVQVQFGQAHLHVRKQGFSWMQDANAEIVQQVLNSARRLNW